MINEHVFARGETAPSWWANALGALLSVASFQFVLSLADSTHVQVVAGANDQAAAISIAGVWRWNEATVSRPHPGGAAGAYDVFVTAAAEDIVSTPVPYTDVTNRAFNLAIVAQGATPAIVAGTVDIYRKVGTLQWDGSHITDVTWLVGTRLGGTQKPGDIKTSLQVADHGVRADGSLEWLLLTGGTDGNGRMVSAAAYPLLYVAMGSPPLTGGQFRLPNPSGRTVVAAGAGNGLTARTAGQTWGTETHVHSVPGLYIPALSVPGLSVPSLSVPSLSIPDLTLYAGGAAHAHGLSNNGGAAITPSDSAGTNFLGWSVTPGPAYQEDRLFYGIDVAAFTSVSSSGVSVPLVGSSDAATVAVSGIAMGSSNGKVTGTGVTGTGTTGGGITGTGTTGGATTGTASSFPPSIAFNMFVAT